MMTKNVKKSLKQAFPESWKVASRIKKGLRSTFLAAPATLRGFWHEPNNWQFPIPPTRATSSEANPLRAFFEARKQGHGIWKWDHYFDIYHRHFNRFRGRAVHVLEIGVYSGGSMDMWRDYFGAQAHIYGVDMEKSCKAYETEAVKIFIGDQADRNLWRQFRDEVPALDIVIDDGGHEFEQQRVTFEEMLSHLRPGGVYLCEDITEVFNPFASYMTGVVHKLNDYRHNVSNENDNERRSVCKTTSFQSAIGSIHFYPFVTVVEKNASPITEMVAPKHGTLWQPFLT